MSVKKKLDSAFKGMLYLLVTALLVLVLINVYNYLSIQPNPRAVEMFLSEREMVDDEDNLLFALIGFNAPAEVVDIHQYGYEVYLEAEAGSLNEAGRYEDVPTVRPPVDAIEFIGDFNRLLCWVGDTADDPMFQDEEECYGDAELIDVIEQNRALLERHRFLKDYRQRQAKYVFYSTSQEVINTHRLYLASIKRDLEVGNSTVIEDLAHDLEYRAGLLSHEVGTIDKAIDLVMFGLSLDHLRHLLVNHRETFAEYAHMVLPVLKEISAEDFSIAGMFIGEFRMMDALLCVTNSSEVDNCRPCNEGVAYDRKANDYILDGFFRLFQSHLAVAGMSYLESQQYCQSDEMVIEPVELYPALFNLFTMPNYIVYHLMEGGLSKGCELYVMHNMHVAKARQAAVYLALSQDGAPISMMDQYLNDSAPVDHLTGQAFIYDREENSIRFPGLPGDDLKRYSMPF